MEHVIFFPAHDGSPAFRRVASLDEAVRLVEHLRNVELVSEVSCHVLTEVPLAFRAYYRVEVPGAEPTPLAQPVAEDPTAQLAAEPVESAELGDGLLTPRLEADSLSPEPAMASANGHTGDGATSLGFFA